MEKKSNIIVIALIALIVVSLTFTGAVFSFLQKEKVKNTALQAELDDLKVKQKATESRLDDSRKTVQNLEGKLKDNLERIDAMVKELNQEKSSKEQVLFLSEQLKNDLEQQKALRFDLENKFTQALDKSKKFQAQFNALESKKIELEKKIKELEEQVSSVELGKIVVSPEGAQPQVKVGKDAKAAKQAESKKAEPALPSLEGKVLVVNKDYNFAVINLGAKEGVNLGDVFSIYHKDKDIGGIKVEKVHDSMSAAGFVSENTGRVVAEGDKVIRK